MNDKLEKQLYSKYPDIFREKDLDETRSCLAWGIECDDGWYDLIDNLCKELKNIQNKYPVNIVAKQIKEKFGDLRFYYDILNNEEDGEFDSKKIIKEVCDTVSRYELLSAKTCEKCGQPGRLDTSKPWWKTLCDKCKS